MNKNSCMVPQSKSYHKMCYCHLNAIKTTKLNLLEYIQLLLFISAFFLMPSLSPLPLREMEGKSVSSPPTEIMDASMVAQNKEHFY